jgi:O-antigen ligase
MFDIIDVPKGYNSALVMLLALPFICIIVLNERKSIVKSFWSVAKYWLPWIVYLFISGLSTAEGIWKLQMYLSIVVLPAMLILVLALANPSVFQKYFMNVLLFLNIFIVFFLCFNIVSVSIIHGAAGIERIIWLSRGIGISIAYIVITPAWRRHNILYTVLIAVLFGVMIYIGSRGPVISLLLTLWLFFFVKYYRKNVLIFFLSAWVMVIIVIAFFNIGYLTDFTRSFVTHGNTSKITGFANDRISVYTPTLRIFADHPLVGVGLGQWWMAYQKYNRLADWERTIAIEKKIRGLLDVQYPHNIFLEILSELGLVGMVCFLLLFFPIKRFFSISNEYNLLCLLGLLYACSSSDITQNSAPMIFNLLSLLRARGFLPLPDEDPHSIKSSDN